MHSKFEYGITRVQEIAVSRAKDELGRMQVGAVLLGDRPLQATKRFWTSLHRLYGFTDNIYRYFSPDEVLQRISQVSSRDRIRYCIETTENKTERLLAVSDPRSALIAHDQLMEVLNLYEAENVKYDMGIVGSQHSPRVGGTYTVAGDEFANKYMLETPIDGFGRPAAYLAMLRMICQNGAIGLSKTFRSEIAVGKAGDTFEYALMRVLEGFNNEEGYAALRQRFESAATSWTSVNEAQRLYQLLTRLCSSGQVKSGSSHPRVIGSDGASADQANVPLLHKYQQLTGDLPEVYGLANLEALSVKRQRTLPAACKVYDLLNFASELATHHATPAGNRALQGFVGTLVSGEYDLEGTADRFGDWQDFFIGNRATTETLASLDRR